MITKCNTKLIDWFEDNQIGPNKAVTLQDIPEDLAEANLKGDLADLVEAKIITMNLKGQFYLYQEDKPGQTIREKEEQAIEYRKHDHLLGDIFNEVSKRSKYKPIFSKELEQKFDINGSDIRVAIRGLRRKGEPIVGSKTGYYLAAGTEDIKELVADLESRISSMRETVTAIKKRAYDRFGTQLTMEL